MDPQVLDIVSIRMSRPQPQHHQQENHLIDDQHYWEKQGVVSWQDLQKAIEDPAGPLWVNGHTSSHGHGLNNRVPEALLPGLDRSLYFVRPEKLKLIIASEGGGFGPPRRRVRAQFDLCGHSYRIGVTDPPVEKQYLAKDDGEHLVKDALLCVSLGETFHGYAYKLAPCVITAKRAGH